MQASVLSQVAFSRSGCWHSSFVSLLAVGRIRAALARFLHPLKEGNDGALPTCPNQIFHGRVQIRKRKEGRRGGRKLDEEKGGRVARKTGEIEGGSIRACNKVGKEAIMPGPRIKTLVIPAKRASQAYNNGPRK